MPAGTSHHHNTHLGKLTAPKTGCSTWHAVACEGREGKRKRSFLPFLACLHTSPCQKGAKSLLYGTVEPMWVPVSVTQAGVSSKDLGSGSGSGSPHTPILSSSGPTGASVQSRGAILSHLSQSVMNCYQGTQVTRNGFLSAEH